MTGVNDNKRSPERLPLGRMTYILASLLLLAPCYWQPRLQGGDLSSRMYNAWVTQWIESGRANGFTIVRQTTDVLFDFLLSMLFHVFNAEFAQRIAVSVTVLIFVWGAFAFVTAVAGRRPWHLMTCIAILAYGWVFHMGFFGFYLSLGICFWMLSLLWEPAPKRWLLALPLAVLAYTAHVLPLIWAAGLIGYLCMARRVSQMVRAYVSAASLLGIVILHVWVDRTMFTAWSPLQIQMSPGFDQGWLFDAKYFLVLVGLLLSWGALFLELLRGSGARRIVSSIPFQICIVGAMGVVILPATLLIPGLNHALVYIAERMSLGVGICVCALVGSVQPRTSVRYALVLVTAIFFVFLYADERRLNSYEDRRQDTVAFAIE